MSTLKVDGIRSNSASSDAITLASDGTCTANITNNLSNRNIIINGAMLVAQRGTSSTSNGYQTVDRITMYHGGTNENPTYSQADVAAGTTPYNLGFRKCFKITNGNQTSTAAADEIQCDYLIEAQDIANSGWNYTSSSSYLTLSYWVKSSVAQEFKGHFKTNDGTNQNFTYSLGTLSANTWTKVTKKIPGNSNVQIDNDNGGGVHLSLFSQMGTDYTSNSVADDSWAAWNGGTRTRDQTLTWWTTNDATFEITGVQLEVGEHATDFEHRSYGDELRRCQRYYYVLADGSAVADEHVGNGRAWSSSQAEISVSWPVIMRSAPSLVHSTGTNYYQWRNGSNEAFQDSLSLESSTVRGAILFKTGTSGLTAGGAYRVQLGNASAYLHFSAEI